MKKKLITLFVACAMVATASVGLVQTAYAAEPNVRIEVADGATDTQKVLTFYYEGFENMNAIQGELSFAGGEVTIESATLTIVAHYGSADKESGVIWFAEDEDGGTSTEDRSFATATITVPDDADITVNFEVQAFENSDFETFEEEIGTVSVTIPKKAAEEPVVEPVEATGADYTGTDETVGSLWFGEVTAASATKVKAVATLADGVTTADGEVELGGVYTGDVSVYVVINKAVGEIKNVLISFE